VRPEASGLLCVVSGPSGTGKTTLCKALVGSCPEMRFSVSHTTRSARREEVEGRDYYFVTPETFKSMVAREEFAEWAEIYGHLYGTSRQWIEWTRAQGLDVLFDIDCQGADQLKAIYPDAVSVFVLPPSVAELERRLRGRETDAPETIRKRLEKSRHEIAQAQRYDYLVTNDVFAETLEVLRAIVVAERHRSARLIKNGPHL
jgi:guanylate kinase